MHEPEFVFVMDVRIEMRKEWIGGASTGERLSISEQITLPPASFIEATSMLARFHDLAQKVKEEHPQSARRG